MQAIIRPGAAVSGTGRVPGDKSIGHRWLILSATGLGRSSLSDLPAALDVRSTARCLGQLRGDGGESVREWAANPRAEGEDNRFTWHAEVTEKDSADHQLIVEGEGWNGLRAASTDLDCGNSGTTMRLLAGVLAGREFDSRLTGDEALSKRPMERVAEPLRALGARISTTNGHAPLQIRGEPLRGTEIHLEVASSQVKSAVLLAGLNAAGVTTVIERTSTRDHAERALNALGAAIERVGLRTTVEAFQHSGFEGTVPGDPSSAIFPVSAALITGGSLSVEGVGLNPTRTRWLEILGRMGASMSAEPRGESLGEPFGSISTPDSPPALRGTTVTSDEMPLVIDDVVMLAVLAACAEGESRFEGAGELRLKESDRLAGLVDGIRGLGGEASVEGNTLVVAGGGFSGGNADARSDHRLAMAFAAGALAAQGQSTIEGIEWAEVSFPGFVETLRACGADIEEA